MAANGNIGNNGGVPPPPPPAQQNAQQLQAPVAQVDLALGWLWDVPEPRKSVTESVIWPQLHSSTALTDQGIHRSRSLLRNLSAYYCAQLLECNHSNWKLPGSIEELATGFLWWSVLTWAFLMGPEHACFEKLSWLMVEAYLQDLCIPFDEQ